MPYEWKTRPDASTQVLCLRPHQSLPAKGFASFILVTFVLILIPVLPLLGTVLLWGLLPFMLAAAAALLASPRPGGGGARPPLAQGPSPLAMLPAGTPRDTIGRAPV